VNDQTFVVFANFMSAMPGKQDWDERSSALYAMAMSDWSDDVVKMVTKASATRFNFRPTPFELRTLALNLILDGYDLNRIVNEIKSIILHMPLHRRQSHLQSLILKDSKYNLVADVVKQSGGWLTIGSIQPERFESVIQSSLVSVLNSSKYELLLTKPTDEWVKHIGDYDGQKEKLLG
jgi:hypothetical protein